MILVNPKARPINGDDITNPRLLKNAEVDNTVERCELLISRLVISDKIGHRIPQLNDPMVTKKPDIKPVVRTARICMGIGMKKVTIKVLLLPNFVEMGSEARKPTKLKEKANAKSTPKNTRSISLNSKKIGFNWCMTSPRA